MRYNILLFAFILLAAAASAQPDTFEVWLPYHQDTAAVVFLVTECDTCPAKALPGYAVYTWKPYSTPQPKMFGMDKKPLPKNLVVWDLRKRDEE